MEQAGRTRGRWVAHPLLGWSVRGAAKLLPFLIGAISAIGAGRWSPPPRTAVGFLAWSVVVTAIVGAVTVGAERLGRKLLPFAFLLRLGLVFPERVPSRFSLALRASPVRDLERRLSSYEGATLVGPTELLTLVARMTAHDRPTRGHSERVRAFTELLGRQLDLSPEDLMRLRWASLLHDIGKVGIPAGVLNKLDPLDGEEVDLIHQHPTIGHSLIAPVASWLGPWSRAIGEHHERWDGAGYPHGLAGHDISFAARVVAVADAYEVMVTGRPYRQRLDDLQARKELVRCAGAQFDPAVVRAFLLVPVRKLRWATGFGSWFGELPFLAGLRVAGRAAAAMGVGTAAALASGVVPSTAPADTHSSAAQSGPVAPMRLDGAPVVDALVITSGELADLDRLGKGPATNHRSPTTTSTATTMPLNDPTNMARLPAVTVPDAPAPPADGVPASPVPGPTLPDPGDLPSVPPAAGGPLAGFFGTWIGLRRRGRDDGE
jgi:hypothetical protein